MAWFEKKKSGKIQAMEAEKDSSGIIDYLKKNNDFRKYPYRLFEQAIQALGRIDDVPAINELIYRYNNLWNKRFSSYDEENIIKALQFSKNGITHNFFNEIYKDSCNKDYKKNICKITAEALINWGHIDILMDVINTFNYSKTIDIEKDFVCSKIKKLVKDDETIKKILSESKVEVFCNAAILKIKDFNIIPYEKLKSILCNKTIANQIIPHINDSKILIKLLHEARYIEVNSNSIAISVSNPIYKIFDLLLREVQNKGIRVTITKNKSSCRLCRGKGTYEIGRYDEESIYYNLPDKTVTCKRCNGKGLVSVQDIIITSDDEFKLCVYRNEKSEIDIIL